MRNWIDLFETTRPDDRWEANEILARAGYEMLGSGSFATVYEKPGSSYVLKLFDSDDTAYIAFIDLVKRNPSPHFPKLIGKPVKVSRGFSAIRMEKLSPYRGDPDIFEVYVTNRDRDLDPHGYMGQRMGDAEELFYEIPSLKTALDFMIDHLTPAFHFDIAQRNIMVRNGTIVFTDPVKNVPNGQDRHIIPMPLKAIPAPKANPETSKKLAQMLDDDALMAELLGEGVERIEVGARGNERTIRVLTNPTPRALEKLCETSQQGIVRFMISGPKIWFWDAYDGTHDYVGKSIGVDAYAITKTSRDPMIGVLKMQPGSFDCEVGHINSMGNMSGGMTKGQWKALCSNPVWSRYSQAMNFYPEHRDMDL